MRSMFQEILNDRRSGKSKGVHSDGSEDLLSILMSFEFYNGKDNEIVDELGTFFFRRYENCPDDNSQHSDVPGTEPRPQGATFK